MIYITIVLLEPYIQDIKKLISKIQLNIAQEKYTKLKGTGLKGLFMMFRHHDADMEIPGLSQDG